MMADWPFLLSAKGEKYSNFSVVVSVQIKLVKSNLITNISILNIMNFRDKWWKKHICIIILSLDYFRCSLRRLSINCFQRTGQKGIMRAFLKNVEEIRFSNFARPSWLSSPPPPADFGPSPSPSPPPTLAWPPWREGDRQEDRARKWSILICITSCPDWGKKWINLGAPSQQPAGPSSSSNSLSFSLSLSLSFHDVKWSWISFFRKLMESWPLFMQQYQTLSKGEYLIVSYASTHQ